LKTLKKQLKAILLLKGMCLKWKFKSLNVKKTCISSNNYAF